LHRTEVNKMGFSDYQNEFKTEARQRLMLSVAREVSQSIIHLAGAGRGTGMVRNDAVHDSTASSEADAIAASAMRAAMKKHPEFADVTLIGEEHAIGTSKPFPRDSLLLIADVLDGSSNFERFGLGFATVLGAASTRNGKDWQLLGGAITINEGLNAVTWGPSGKPLLWHKDQLVPATNAPLRGPSVIAFAGRSNPTYLAELSRDIRRVTNDVPVVHPLGGNPIVYSLLRSGVHAAVEKKR
jgi:fructose-1,6-bisphosphatase/inositol monophosphatase family enzyme